MKKAANDNTDTWTHISVAAERVLIQINETEDLVADEQQEAAHHDDSGENDSKRTNRAGVVWNRKLAL